MLPYGYCLFSQDDPAAAEPRGGGGWLGNKWPKRAEMMTERLADTVYTKKKTKKKRGSLFLSRFTYRPMAIAQCNNKMMRTEEEDVPKLPVMWSRWANAGASHWRNCGPQRIETARLGGLTLRLSVSLSLSGAMALHGWPSYDEFSFSRKPVEVVVENKTRNFQLDFHLRRQGLI